eukprot:1306279-Ditylum_brightwellii.AAC.1
MCQAKLSDILVEGYAAPVPSEDEYDEYKLKENFSKNHLLTTTFHFNASSFLNVKTMPGLQVYQKLLSVFLGQEYNKDKVVNTTGEFEKLKFHMSTCYSPEAILVKVNESLKRIGKVDHPIFQYLEILVREDKGDLGGNP